LGYDTVDDCWGRLIAENGSTLSIMLTGESPSYRDCLQGCSLTLIGLKEKSGIEIFAVDDAYFWIPSLRSDDKVPAEEINGPISLPGEGAVRQADNIPVHGCINRSLNRWEIPGPIRIDHVSTGCRPTGQQNGQKERRQA
jgi:hypothetical protein